MTAAVYQSRRRMEMEEIREEAVDVPEPEDALTDAEPEISQVDPGSDTPWPRCEPDLGEDPAYDPGGIGRQPDVAEEEEDYR
jgi:hypothetical protein